MGRMKEQMLDNQEALQKMVSDMATMDYDELFSLAEGLGIDCQKYAYAEELYEVIMGNILVSVH